MIKLERNITPLQLTPIFVDSKTKEFATNKTNVWNLDWLKTSLLELSFDKCAYCECNLKEESKYMEVEHFEDKDNNSHKVLQWNNLLPSCKRCNGSKGTHDVLSNPIINPFIDTPSTHLTLDLYRFKPKTTKGNMTIGVLDLNHTERAIKKRFEVGNGLIDTIEKASERLELFEAKQTTIRKNKLTTIIEEILKECQPYSIYSATCSTVLHSNNSYNEIKGKLQTYGLWNSDLESLHSNSINLIL